MAALLTACGGGGGGDGGGGSRAVSDGNLTTAATVSSFQPKEFAPSASLANVCTPEGQKQWVRSYLNESYLWYDEIAEVDPAAYPSVSDYFDALLVRTPTAVSQAKDKFSYAAAAGSRSTVQASTQAGIPPLGTDLVASGKVFEYWGRKVGYILFNGHTSGAQDRMIGVFQGLKDAGAQDVVLDLRYNSGGYIYVARTVASMVAGPDAHEKVFASLRYNDKRAQESAANTFFFSRKVSSPAEPVFPLGHLLPQLSLPRLYVLTSGWTCSASEAVINSLRGIGVQVVLIGDTTCGKPYGFQPKDNCGLSFSAIEFEMSNALGESNYTAGFKPTCKVAERRETLSLTQGLGSGLLGSGSEPLLSAALDHIRTGQCPAGTAMGVDISTPARGPNPLAAPGWFGNQLHP